MASEFRIEGASPFNGSYELDLSVPFNHAESHIIKQVSGLRGGEIEEAFDANDTDLLVALALIALYRAGKFERRQVRQVEDVLMSAPLGGLTFVAEEEAPDPLPVTPGSSDDARSDANGNPPSSGAPTNGTSDSQGNDLSPTGSPGSPTTSTSGPATSPV